MLCDVESRGFPAWSGENQCVHLCNAGYYNSKLSVDSARNHDTDHVVGYGFSARRSDFVRTSGERENDGVSRRFSFAAKFFAKNEKSIVLIHDGVRPLISEKVITDNIRSVIKYGSAITTAKVKETILVVNEETATIDYVPNRSNSRVAKAPQSFWLDDIWGAHEKSLFEGENNCIDSCTMMQKYGFNLHLIDGPGENIKITTPEDFYTMRAILEAKENEQIYGFEEK